MSEELSLAMRDVIAERKRQIEEEGWSARHDDSHRNGELAQAAACYAAFAASSDEERATDDSPPIEWPWAPSWWKPKDRRRDLVRSVALGIAEIERLDRDSQRYKSAPPPPVTPISGSNAFGRILRPILKSVRKRVASLIGTAE